VTQPPVIVAAPAAHDEPQPAAAVRADTTTAPVTVAAALAGPVLQAGVAAPHAAASPREAAAAAAMTQLAQEAAQTPAGTVRNLELHLKAGDLGAVRVRLSLDHAGAVRVTVRAASEQAAQALRAGVPQLADALAARHLSLSSAAVQVMGGAEFGGSNHPRQQPRWVERARKSGPGAGVDGEPVLAALGVARPAGALMGVDVLA
jgi:flagellar hook-length control protein FliK